MISIFIASCRPLDTLESSEALFEVSRLISSLIERPWTVCVEIERSSPSAQTWSYVPTM